MAVSMIKMPLSRVVLWNGGQPYSSYERAIYRHLENDLSPIVEGLKPGVVIPGVVSLFKGFALPNGWAYVGSYNHTPQLHLKYDGIGLKELHLGDEAGVDVFICIACTSKDRHELSDSLRAIYVRDMPFDSTEPGRLDTWPLNNPAAWFTLLVHGTEEVGCSWKMSHAVQGRITLEGEVAYGELS